MPVQPIKPPERTDFKIWQQNLRKSMNTSENMLKNLDPETYNLACIQEPYLHPINLANASNLRCHWDVLYPLNHHTNPERSQTIILINKRISKNTWHIVPINSLNIMAIDLTGAFSKVHVYNIYNPCDHNNMLH
ncbi:uncharacterized protein EDB91DRAFT_1060070, partial [Suillus paluster]|uniref:uncharacterized protein n=1 Tax=Suillus paluster TaxID=48578 RepID=UPI001B8848EC